MIKLNIQKSQLKPSFRSHLKEVQMLKKQKEFQVQKIIDRRELSDSIQYLVVWKGYNEHQATWQPAEYFEHAPRKVRVFQRKRKRKLKIEQRKAKKKESTQQQNILFNTERVSSLGELETLIKGNLRDDPPIPEVLPKIGALQPKTFQTFLTQPVNQLIKVQRYNAIRGKWTQKLETAAEIIGKNAARQLYRTNSHQDLITITGISSVKGHYTVRFAKDEKHYQCELSDLQEVCPNEIIDYLLTCYDPSLKKLREDIEDSESPLSVDNSNSES